MGALPGDALSPPPYRNTGVNGGSPRSTACTFVTGFPPKTSCPDVYPDGVGLESRETCAQKPPAPRHVLLSLVQARGAISVHALVRGPESLLTSPFARCRALKGDQAPTSRARWALFGTIPLWRRVRRDRPHETLARVPEYLVRGPCARSLLTRWALCGTTYKWRGTSREHDARTVCGIAKYVRRKECLITDGPEQDAEKGNTRL